MKKLVQFGQVTVFAILLCAASLASDGSAPTAKPALGRYAVLSNGFSIRHLRSEVVGSDTRLFTTTDDNASYVDVPTSDIVRFEQDEIESQVLVNDTTKREAADAKAVTAPLSAIVADAGTRHQVDPDFIASVIRAESSGNAHAISLKGARGLMQLMPQTASKLGVVDTFDPASNVDGGTRYLRQLLEQYNGDPIRALAAYNAGTKRVQQYAGVPPYRETRSYVSRIIRDYNRSKIAQDPSLAAKAKHPSKKKVTAKTADSSLVRSAIIAR